MADDLSRGIEPHVLAQLEALELDPARPLLAVDADEVLVVFAAELAQFVAGLGYEMRLTEYRLEGAIRAADTGAPIPFDAAIGLIGRYFGEASHAQPAMPGAAAALERLSSRAQVVVLTNVPRAARETRIARLAELGMPYPLVENSGGKGPALAWMAARAGAPVAFIDDSPSQIESAARSLPEALHVHFTGSAFIAGVMPHCAAAGARAADWDEAEALLARHFGG